MTLLNDYLPRGVVILDASVLINLLFSQLNFAGIRLINDAARYIGQT